MGCNNSSDTDPTSRDGEPVSIFDPTAVPAKSSLKPPGRRRYSGDRNTGGGGGLATSGGFPSVGPSDNQSGGLVSGENENEGGTSSQIVSVAVKTVTFFDEQTKNQFSTTDEPPAHQQKRRNSNDENGLNKVDNSVPAFVPLGMVGEEESGEGGAVGSSSGAVGGAAYTLAPPTGSENPLIEPSSSTSNTNTNKKVVDSDDDETEMDDDVKTEESDTETEDISFGEEGKDSPQPEGNANNNPEATAAVATNEDEAVRKQEQQEQRREEEEETHNHSAQIEQLHEAGRATSPISPTGGARNSPPPLRASIDSSGMSKLSNNNNNSNDQQQEEEDDGESPSKDQSPLPQAISKSGSEPVVGDDGGLTPSAAEEGEGGEVNKSRRRVSFSAEASEEIQT